MSLHTLGTAGGIPISVPDGSYVSFFNSPYVGHRLATSVDVYTEKHQWGDPVLSPVSGEVKHVRRIKMGQTRAFSAEDYDYAVGILPDGSERAILRTLHCSPTVSPGNRVEVGEEIGSVLRSRFFCFWTSPHYHIDVMDEADFHRSSKSYPMEIAQQALTTRFPGQVIDSDGLQCSATYVGRDYAIAASDDLPICSVGSYTGLVAVDTARTVVGIIDVGFPYYPFCGTYRGRTATGCPVPHGWTLPLGQLIHERDGLSVHNQAQGYGVFANETRIRGISTYLYTAHQLTRGQIPLKLVPQSPGGFEGILVEGESFMVTCTRM